jgi:protein subunit release factor A
MLEKEKTLLFSLTAKDFEFQTFCTGGKGGQHRNAKQNGVRCIHPASGARGEHRDGRDQYRNKIAAFEKMAESPLFKAWHRLEVARRLGTPIETRTIDEIVDDQMKDILLEYV